MSQTRRNLTIEFLDLNFASRRKLCKNSVFCENMNTVAYILFRKAFIFSCFCLFQYHKCIALPSLSDIDVLRDSVPDLKISIRSVTANTFNWLRRKFFWLEEVGGGLATGWLVDSGKYLTKTFLMQRCVMPRASELKKLFVSLYISQHNANLIFGVKRSTISEIS